MSYRSVLITAGFWLEAADRAIKSFAHSMLLAWGVGDVIFSIWDVSWMETVGFGLGGAAISLLTAIASAGMGSPGNASMLSVPGSTPPEAAPADAEDIRELYNPPNVVTGDGSGDPLPDFDGTIERDWPERQ